MHKCIGFGYYRLYIVLSDPITPYHVKMRFIESSVRPLSTYDAEAWTPSNAEFTHIDSNVLKIYRRAICYNAHVCNPILRHLLYIYYVKRDFIYLKKIFWHFSRHSSPDGIHNRLITELIKSFDVHGILPPNSDMRVFMNMWYALGEDFHYRWELKASCDIWNTDKRTREFDRKNVNNKYINIVSEWMRLPDNICSKRDCLAE